MNAQQQKTLTEDITRRAAEFVTKQIESGKIPESWDGIELREYLADTIRWNSPMDKRRKREYNNTVMVNGL